MANPERQEDCKGMFGSVGYVNLTPACTGGNSVCQNCPTEVIEEHAEKWRNAVQSTAEEKARYNAGDWGVGQTLVGRAMLLESLKGSHDQDTIE
jgi:hypothetical protein